MTGQKKIEMGTNWVAQAMKESAAAIARMPGWKKELEAAREMAVPRPSYPRWGSQ